MSAPPRGGFGPRAGQRAAASDAPRVGQRAVPSDGPRVGQRAVASDGPRAGQRHYEPAVVDGPPPSKALQTLLVQARQTGHLKLRGRQLEELPPAAFDIGSVPLPEGSPWWETRETLETIDASQNALRALPDSLGRLTSMRKLMLANNQVGPRIEHGDHRHNPTQPMLALSCLL